MFKKKGESFLGVDFGAGGIKIVELRKTKGRPQLWTYGTSNVELDIHIKPPKPEKEEKAEQPSSDSEEDKTPKEEKASKEKKEKSADAQISLEDPRIETYAGYLKELLETSKATTRSATASLPVSHVFHAVVTLPKVDEKELEHHIQAKVKKMISRPIEDMQVVHQIIPVDNKDAGYIKLLVTAAPKELVTFYSAIFQKAGLELNALETEAFALQRSLIGSDKTTSMVVDIGAERTNFFIIDQALPITHRSIEIGGNNFSTLLEKHLGIGADVVSQVKCDMAQIPSEKIPTEVFHSLIDPIVKEIEYSFDLFLRQTGNEEKHPEKIVLSGGSSVFPPIIKHISDTFPMKVFVGDPWARVVYQQGLKPLLDSIGPRMTVCIGLAMRNIIS